MLRGGAWFQQEITTQHTLYRTNREYLPKTVTIVIDVSYDGSHFERVATLYVDLGTMCNTSSQGLVEADAQAAGEGRPTHTYKISVRANAAHDSTPIMYKHVVESSHSCVMRGRAIPDCAQTASAVLPALQVHGASGSDGAHTVLMTCISLSINLSGMQFTALPAARRMCTRSTCQL